MSRFDEPSLFDRDPTAAAEVSITGWVGAAWLACALWLGLGMLGRDEAYLAATLWTGALVTAAIMGALLWVLGQGFNRLLHRAHRAGGARYKPAIRIVVMMMFVLSFMAATGLYILLVEIV